jgi:hypothetical protein
MIKKKVLPVEPLDLTQLEDYEIRTKGIEFLEDLIGVLEKHEPFYMTQYDFCYLSITLSKLRKRLAQQEYEAA